MKTKTRATIEDLYTLPDNAKAEIVGGEIVLMSPAGDMPTILVAVASPMLNPPYPGGE
jgi:hypothetical protein